MDVMEAIRQRRSVRSYKSDSIPEDTLNDLLEAVRWAPSWANTQCWEVIVVRKDETKRQLADTLPQANPAREGILKAPLTLVLLGTMGKAGFFKGEVSTDKGDWYMFDVALAMQNLCLAAHAKGLGTVIVGLFDALKAAKILKVPQGTVVVAMTPLGLPAESPRLPKRKEIGEFVYEDVYGRH